MAISLGASNRVPWRRTLQAVRASLFANATAASLRGMRATVSVNQGPKLKADHLFCRIMITFAAWTKSMRR
jgi:hypothetical protein